MLMVAIHNDGTGTNESANYDVDVYINEHLLTRLRVEGHNREDGWAELLRMIADESINAEISGS